MFFFFFSFNHKKVFRNMLVAQKLLQIVILENADISRNDIQRIKQYCCTRRLLKTYCKKSCKTRRVIIFLLPLFFLFRSNYRIKDIVAQKNNGNEKRDMENNYEPLLYSRFAAKYRTLVHALALRKLNFMTQGP